MTVALRPDVVGVDETEIPWPRLAAHTAIAVLLTTHPVSFANLLIDTRPSAALAVIMLGLIVVLLPRFARELTSPAGMVYSAFLGWQLLTLVFHVLPLTYLSHWSSPALLANALSYLLVPQVLCFLLGAAIARERAETDRVLRVMLWSHLVAVGVGLLFYLVRPGFVAAAEARVFGELSDRYLGFLPRMNGYLNSMIMGAVCVSGIALVASARRRVPAGAVVVVLFALGSFLTLQRSSWLLMATTFLCWGALGAGRFLFAGRLGSRPLVTLGLIAVTVAALLGAWSFAREQLWYDIAKQEMENRFKFFDTIVEERSGQWESALALVQESPVGVGVGMASHKAAEVDGLNPFAVPDGNYFRYLAETGVPGLILLLVLLGRGLLRTAIGRRWELLVPLLLLLIASVGTNVLDLYYIGFVCWLLIGMANGVALTPPASASASASAGAPGLER